MGDVSSFFYFFVISANSILCRGRLSCERCTKLKRKCGMMEEDSKKGSGGKRKRVAADDGDEDERKTRSTAEQDWVGRVIGGIEGLMRTMEDGRE